MTEKRLASGLLVSALIRRVNGDGGFATVIAKGDETAGTILVLTAEKGRNTGLLERIRGMDGAYEWAAVGPQDIDNKEEFESYISRRRRSDPDLWLIELDVPDAARFTAELTFLA